MPHCTLITGASSGIGEATARVFAEHGHDLILVARRSDRLKELAAKLSKQHGISVSAHALDVTDEKGLIRFFASLEDKNIDVIVNNAGLALGTEPLQDASTEDADAMIAVNISGFLHVIEQSLPFLQKSKGHLVNVGSIAGLDAYRGGTVYCGTKHFVHGASKGLRHDLLGTGVRVTEIAPARVETEFSVVRYKGDAKRAKAVYEGFTPLAPTDIAEAIWFAVSRPKHVTIEHLIIYPTDQASATAVVKRA
jgi:NADP-dependent 3-hydroxy acid dehydrogenase YdfG